MEASHRAAVVQDRSRNSTKRRLLQFKPHIVGARLREDDERHAGAAQSFAIYDNDQLLRAEPGADALGR